MFASFNVLAWLIWIVLLIVCIALSTVIAGFIVIRTYKHNPNDSSVGSSMLQMFYSLLYGMIAGMLLFAVLYWQFSAIVWAL